MAEAYRAFGSYLRFKEIASDPLGRLYRAGEFSSSGVSRTVWLRVFDRAEIPAEDIIGDFGRTQQISGAVTSSSVASGVEGVVAEGVPGIACDYVPSQPLSVIFDRATGERFPIPVDNALLILEKVALALSATLTVEIDGNRVVHGFVHPALIFVTNDGEGIVTGFGVGDHLLALIDDQANAATVHPYLAPEILAARMPSRRGDVYSLGALLFHLLTGRALPVPPEARADAIAGAHLAYDDEPVPDDIKSLLQRALAERPDDRFSSAADFKKELDKLLYGGAYSPTTFNLALFMDRLFRTEIEEEEKERASENDVDVTPYLAPQTALEPDPDFEFEEGASSPSSSRSGLWLGAGAIGAIAVAVAIWAALGRGSSTPPLPPTPTAEEVAAQREAQEEKMRALAQGLVQEMMAEKEEEIRQELLDRQSKIEELQQKLVQSERRAQQGQLSRDEQKTREELQRQIEAEESAQRQREAELEAERQRAADEARQQAEVAQTATAVVAEEERLAAAALAAQPAETPTPPPPQLTADPIPPATAVVATAAAIERNTFVDPSEVDSLPVIIKEAPVDWPRAAMNSLRRGVVIVQVTVDADGRVEDAKLLRADHEEFGIAQAVVNAARKYRFKPGTKDGVPIKTHATVSKVYRFVSGNHPTKRAG